MALTKNVTHKDIAITDCYIRVKSFSGNKNSMVAKISFHASQTSEEFKTENITGIPITLNSVNFIEQIYNHIKTLSDYNGCKDC